jgi:hypothetical protein
MLKTKTSLVKDSLQVVHYLVGFVFYGGIIHAAINGINGYLTTDKQQVTSHYRLVIWANGRWRCIGLNDLLAHILTFQ